MTQRPISITIISWLFIVLSSLSILGFFIAMNNPQVRTMSQEILAEESLPIPFLYAISLLSLCALITSGVAMLKGQGWGRWLYVAMISVGFIIELVIPPFSVPNLLQIIVPAVIITFLFQPSANQYFQKR